MIYALFDPRWHNKALAHYMDNLSHSFPSQLDENVSYEVHELVQYEAAMLEPTRHEALVT